MHTALTLRSRLSGSLRLLTATLLALMLVAASCGGGDDDVAAEDPTEAPVEAEPTAVPEPTEAPTAEPEPEPTAAVAEPEPEAPAVDFEDPALVAAGMDVFETNCARCHGSDGAGTSRGKALTDLAINKPDPAEQVLLVTEGQGTMPPFAESLSADEINAVVAYARGTF